MKHLREGDDGGKWEGGSKTESDREGREKNLEDVVSPKILFHMV